MSSLALSDIQSRRPAILIPQSWIGQVENAPLTLVKSHRNSQKLKERTQETYNPDTPKGNNSKQKSINSYYNFAR